MLASCTLATDLGPIFINFLSGLVWSVRPLHLFVDNYFYDTLSIPDSKYDFNQKLNYSDIRTLQLVVLDNISRCEVHMYWYVTTGVLQY